MAYPKDVIAVGDAGRSGGFPGLDRHTERAGSGYKNPVTHVYVWVGTRLVYSALLLTRGTREDNSP